MIVSGGFANVKLLGSTAANTFDLSQTTLSGITAIDLISGNDRLIGSAGADTIMGGTGNGNLLSGDGDDVFQVGSAAGTDIYDGGTGTDTLMAIANAASLTVTGANLISLETITAGAFTGLQLVGTSAANVLDFSTMTLVGVAGINGASGNDAIIGSAGDDVIEGGAGGDSLTGGLGADLFDYNLATHRKGTANIDRITDFTQGADHIDLSTIDADGIFGAVDAFAFIATAAFHGVAGELRFDTTSLVGVTRILADPDGNKTIDVEIDLTRTYALTATDFLL